MFSLRQIEEDGFAIVLLKNEENGCYAKITPEACASIHAFGIKKDEEDIQIIEHYRSLEEFEGKHPGHKGSKLSPFVCRLRNGHYSFGGKEYQVEHLNDKGKHALHGFLYHKAFEIIGSEVTRDAASVSMKYSYDNDDKGYPFKFDCIITYRLLPDNKLSVTSGYVNHSDWQIPIQDGWHPYFNLGEKADDMELEFRAVSQYVFDQDLVPTGEKIPYHEFKNLQKIGSLHLDNSFVLDRNKPQPMCRMRSPKNGIEIAISPDASYPILQIYTPPDRRSVAIENLSGPPDDFNLKEYLKVLTPGESVDYTVTYQINLI